MCYTCTSLSLPIVCCAPLVRDCAADAWEWVKPTISGTAPSPRAGHTATQHNHLMYVFGGGTGWSGETFNDLYVLDTAALLWYRYVRRLGDTVWRVLRTGGACPCALFATDVVACLCDWMDWSWLSNMFTTHVVTRGSDVEWLSMVCPLVNRPSFSGAPPPGRAGHSATLIKSNIVVFGGGDQRRSFNDIHILDTNVMTWSRPTDAGDVPHPRTGHSATGIGDLLLIFGGGSLSCDADNDMFVLDTGVLLRNVDGDGRNVPLPLSFPACFMVVSYGILCVSRMLYTGACGLVPMRGRVEPVGVGR